MALGLSQAQTEVHIYDQDDIDETNLNRQVLFYKAVGQPKAPVLAARLQQLFPKMKLCGYGLAIDERSSQHLSAPLLVACPDNFAVRALLNDVACSRQKTLVNDGTSAMGGSCMTYAPQHTACLSCRLNIDELAQQERQARSCAQVEASVVTSNAITGALMAWKTRELGAGKVKAGIWEYDGRGRGVRVGVHSPRPPCGCHLS